MKDIIKKLQKLLALSASDNENEAKKDISLHRSVGGSQRPTSIGR